MFTSCSLWPSLFCSITFTSPSLQKWDQFAIPKSLQAQLQHTMCLFTPPWSFRSAPAFLATIAQLGTMPVSVLPRFSRHLKPMFQTHIWNAQTTRSGPVKVRCTSASFRCSGSPFCGPHGIKTCHGDPGNSYMTLAQLLSIHSSCSATDFACLLPTPVYDCLNWPLAS